MSSRSRGLERLSVTPPLTAGLAAGWGSGEAVVRRVKQRMDLTGASDQQVLAVMAEALRELKRRQLVRSGNNPIADIAEGLAATQLGLELAPMSATGYDGVDAAGLRYQIKARRLTGGRGDRQLGVIRNLDQGGFDYLVAGLFGENFDLEEMWKFPISLVRQYAKYRAHVNGHILHIQGAVLADSRAERLL